MIATAMNVLRSDDSLT